MFHPAPGWEQHPCHCSPTSYFLSLLSPALYPLYCLVQHSFTCLRSFLFTFFFSAFSPLLLAVSHFFPPSSLTISLPQDPKERLGCHPQTGFADIMGHPFFRNVDWDLVRYLLLFSPLFFSTFLALFIDFVASLVRFRRLKWMYQVKRSPCIDSAGKEKQKASAGQQKVKSKCTNSASLHCPAGLAAPSEHMVVNDLMGVVSLWKPVRRLTAAKPAGQRWEGNWCWNVSFPFHLSDRSNLSHLVQ